VQHHYKGHWKGWALKIETFLGPEMAGAKRVPFGPRVMMLHPSKPLCISVIKTTGTLVVLCTRVLLCSVVVCFLCVVVCCCVLLCEKGVGRSPCSYVVGGIQGWGVVGWPPPPTICSVGIQISMDACSWGGGGVL
jgi:hypothetical protein